MKYDKQPLQWHGAIWLFDLPLRNPPGGLITDHTHPKSHLQEIPEFLNNLSCTSRYEMVFHIAGFSSYAILCPMDQRVFCIQLMKENLLLHVWYLYQEAFQQRGPQDAF
jgi:hypothetical protein